MELAVLVAPGPGESQTQWHRGTRCHDQRGSGVRAWRRESTYDDLV